MPAKAISWVTLAAPRPLIRKIESGASGLRWRCSLTTNAASSASAPASSPIVRAAPHPIVGCLYERVHEQEHSAGGEHGAEEVEVRKPCAASLAADQREDSGPSTNTHGDRVDEHHPAPARPLGQQPAEEHADRRGESGDAAPDPERGVALFALLEAGGQDRQRGRERHRGAEALRETRGDQHARAAGKPADQRRERRSRRSRRSGLRRRPSRSAARPPSSMNPP